MHQLQRLRQVERNHVAEDGRDDRKQRRSSTCVFQKIINQHPHARITNVRAPSHRKVVGESSTHTMNAITHEDHERRIATVAPTILLSSGRYFSFLEPTPLTISEVAMALSKLCRFTGHCNRFYSVAQHSVLVSRLVPPHLAAQGLLHDAVEAVLGDMSGPLKKLFPEYKALENRIEAVVLGGFGLPVHLDPLVKRADLVALRTEQRDLMPRAGGLWMCLDGIEPHPLPIYPYGPEMAAGLFLARYHELVDIGAFHSTQ